MVQVNAGARIASLARTLSTACCFSSKKPVGRDEIKARRGLTRDRVEFGWGLSAADDEDEDGPGSGDEDVLVSLGASYRAWRVYHREKRAHDYTKSRLVDAFRRETALEKQLARVGGSTEGIECMLMKMEDLEATVTASAETYDDKLSAAETAKLRWKQQYQQLISKLALGNLEKQRLVGELRNVKKAAVLMANRQYALLEANNRAFEPLSRTDENDKRASKKRSYSAVKIGQSML